jgi:hypothetical protein
MSVASSVPKYVRPAVHFMKEERAVICSLSAEGLPGAETHRRMSVHYGNSAVLQRSVYEWSVQKWLHKRQA